ncbi:MAG: hypothetical protein GY926_05945 [bacterium]|nr:hypothetical protein [bacterium]
MTRSITITPAEFEQGSSLPRLCAITGAPADRMYARRAGTRLLPILRAGIFLAVPLLILISPVFGGAIFLAVPLLILIASTRPTLNGWLPISDRTENRLVKLRRIRLATLVLFVALLIGYEAAHPIDDTIDALTAKAAIGLFIGLIALVVYVEHQHLGIELTKQGVKLTNINPRFADQAEHRPLC